MRRSRKTLPRPPKGFRHARGFIGYAVDRAGQVVSCRRRGHGHAEPFETVWRTLKLIKSRPKPSTKPAYLKVHLRGENGKRRKVAVHQLVLRAFVGPCPTGMEACHGNGVFTDNSLHNLRWDTPRANNADKQQHGTHREGVLSHLAKLTTRMVRTIRASKENYKTLAAQHGVTPSNILYIRRRATWKHVR